MDDRPPIDALHSILRSLPDREQRIGLALMWRLWRAGFGAQSLEAVARDFVERRGRVHNPFAYYAARGKRTDVVVGQAAARALESEHAAQRELGLGWIAPALKERWGTQRT